MSSLVKSLFKIYKRLDWIDWLIWFGGGTFALVSSIHKKSPILGLFSMIILFIGVGKFMRARWVWQIELSVYLSFGFFNLYSITTKDPTVYPAVLVGLCAWSAWHTWKKRHEVKVGSDQQKSPPRPKDSLVIWFRALPYLDLGTMTEHAERAFGVRFSDENESTCFVVGGGDTGIYMMRVNNVFLSIICREQSYFEDNEAAASSMRELRCAKAVRDHTAWLAVDLMSPSEELPAEQKYRMLAKLVAEFADENVAAVFHPESGRIAPCGPELKEALQGVDPMRIFGSMVQAPVIPVDGNSEQMLQAAALARRRWPEFVAAFQMRQEGQERFSIKAPITEGGHTEYIWIMVKSISSGRIHGLLANDPVDLGPLKINDFVSVDESEVSDWCYLKKANGRDEPVGLFSVKAINDITQA